jgi:hypothetical protein
MTSARTGELGALAFMCERRVLHLLADGNPEAFRISFSR